MRVSRPLLGTAADVLALVLAIAGAISFLLGHGGWQLGLSCAVVTAGLVALVLCWQQHRTVFAAVAVLLVGLGAGGIGAAIARVPSGTPPRAELRFSPQLDPVPYCYSFSGTGTIPAGHQILIFDRGTDPADPATPYYFHGQAAATDRGWVARNIGIGLEPTAADTDEGARIDLYAQLVSEETARVLRDRANIVIFPENPASQWLLKELPGRTADTLHLVRSAGAGDCTPA